MKSCRPCSHRDREYIDAFLRQGRSPRALLKRLPGLNRKELTHHRDVCVKRKEASGDATTDS